jgi:hypothetical protein
MLSSMVHEDRSKVAVTSLTRGFTLFPSQESVTILRKQTAVLAWSGGIQSSILRVHHGGSTLLLHHEVIPSFRT